MNKNWQDTIEHVKRLADLPRNWNSYGADPVCTSSIEATVALLVTLSNLFPAMDVPSVSASPAGYVMLAILIAGKELDLEIIDDGRINYNFES